MKVPKNRSLSNENLDNTCHPLFFDKTVKMLRISKYLASLSNYSLGQV